MIPTEARRQECNKVAGALQWDLWHVTDSWHPSVLETLRNAFFGHRKAEGQYKVVSIWLYRTAGPIKHEYTLAAVQPLHGAGETSWLRIERGKADKNPFFKAKFCDLGSIATTQEELQSARSTLLAALIETTRADGGPLHLVEWIHTVGRASMTIGGYRLFHSNCRTLCRALLLNTLHALGLKDPGPSDGNSTKLLLFHGSCRHPDKVGSEHVQLCQRRVDVDQLSSFLVGDSFGGLLEEDLGKRMYEELLFERQARRALNIFWSKGRAASLAFVKECNFLNLSERSDLAAQAEITAVRLQIMLEIDSSNPDALDYARVYLASSEAERTTPLSVKCSAFAHYLLANFYAGSDKHTDAIKHVSTALRLVAYHRHQWLRPQFWEPAVRGRAVLVPAAECLWQLGNYYIHCGILHKAWNCGLELLEVARSLGSDKSRSLIENENTEFCLVTCAGLAMAAKTLEAFKDSLGARLFLELSLVWAEERVWLDWMNAAYPFESAVRDLMDFLARHKWHDLDSYDYGIEDIQMFIARSMPSSSSSLRQPWRTTGSGVERKQLARFLKLGSTRSLLNAGNARVNVVNAWLKAVAEAKCKAPIILKSLELPSQKSRVKLVTFSEIFLQLSRDKSSSDESEHGTDTIMKSVKRTRRKSI